MSKRQRNAFVAVATADNRSLSNWMLHVAMKAAGLSTTDCAPDGEAESAATQSRDGKVCNDRQ